MGVGLCMQGQRQSGAPRIRGRHRQPPAPAPAHLTHTHACTRPPTSLSLGRNVARRQVEKLRQALRWELAPVLADWDPRFNAEAPVIFDKVFTLGTMVVVADWCVCK